MLVFQPDIRFEQSPTVEGSAWSEIIPKGGGFVRLTATDYTAMTGMSMSSHGSREFCISAFHQIHCLMALKQIFDDYRSGTDAKPHHGHDPGFHADHCFDYLRQVRPLIFSQHSKQLIMEQSIMCSGDVSLEPLSQYPNGTVARGVNGYGAMHQCKDWSAMMAFAAKHRLSNGTDVVQA